MFIHSRPPFRLRPGYVTKSTRRLAHAFCKAARLYPMRPAPAARLDSPGPRRGATEARSATMRPLGTIHPTTTPHRRHRVVTATYIGPPTSNQYTAPNPHITTDPLLSPNPSKSATATIDLTVMHTTPPTEALPSLAQSVQLHPSLAPLTPLPDAVITEAPQTRRHDSQSKELIDQRTLRPYSFPPEHPNAPIKLHNEFRYISTALTIS